MVYQMPVSFEHAATGIFLGCIDNFIRLRFNPLVDLLIPAAPLLRLRKTGKDKDQLNLRNFFTQLENYL